MSTALRALYPPQPRYTFSQLLPIFANTPWISSDVTAKFVSQERSILLMLAHSYSERMLGDLLVILALLVESSYLYSQRSPSTLLGRLLIIASTCIIFLQYKKPYMLRRREDGMYIC